MTLRGRKETRTSLKQKSQKRNMRTPPHVLSGWKLKSAAKSPKREKKKKLGGRLERASKRRVSGESKEGGGESTRETANRDCLFIGGGGGSTHLLGLKERATTRANSAKPGHLSNARSGWGGKKGVELGIKRKKGRSMCRNP